MTVRNAAPYLREAIDSVVNQTMTDWELIIVDNGSTDESPAILASYMDARIRKTCLPKDIGRTPALRLAFEQARGEYIAVLDADDRSHPERLAKQVGFLDCHSGDVLVGSWTLDINEAGAVIGKDEPTTDHNALHEWLGWGNPIVHSSAMYRARCAADVGGYPPDLAYAQDFGLWIRLARAGGVAMIDEYLCDRRVRSEGMTAGGQFGVDIARDVIVGLEYARNHLKLDRNGLRRNRKEATIARVKYGVALIRRGQLAPGCRAIGRAFLSHPTGFVFNRVLLKQFSK